jgi:hypothetical protein
VLAETQTDFRSEIAHLRAAIDREAAATSGLLSQHPSWSGWGGDGGWGSVEPTELGRQLAALRERVARALSRGEDEPAVRAELATLLSFAETLRSDAEGCREAFEEGLRGIQRQEETARREAERVAAERGALVRRRDALQASIDDIGERMARATGGECRRTVPVLTLAAAVTVCSSMVFCPRRRFRSAQCWLITLNEARDQIVIRRSYV